MSTPLDSLEPMVIETPLSKLGEYPTSSNYAGYLGGCSRFETDCESNYRLLDRERKEKNSVVAKCITDKSFEANSEKHVLRVPIRTGYKYNIVCFKLNGVRLTVTCHGAVWDYITYNLSVVVDSDVHFVLDTPQDVPVSFFVKSCQELPKAFNCICNHESICRQDRAMWYLPRFSASPEGAAGPLCTKTIDPIRNEHDFRLNNMVGSLRMSVPERGHVAQIEFRNKRGERHVWFNLGHIRFNRDFTVVLLTSGKCIRKYVTFGYVCEPDHIGEVVTLKVKSRLEY
jgi:hypothetical protein